MPWKVLITAPYMQPVVGRFMPLFEKEGIEAIVPPVRERMTEDQLLAVMADIDGVISGDDRFTRRVFAAAPKLKVISKWGTGIDSIDRAAAAEFGVRICNTPNAFTDPVADSVLAAILSFARRIPDLDRNMKAGRWHKTPAVGLCECTLGIIGVGNIGKAVARRAAAFGMTLLGNDPKPMPVEFLAETAIQMLGKDELLARADFVTLNCDLNPTSHHLMSDAQFARMKRTAFIINMARGPIIDEPALVRALQKKLIAGAALDVFETEPLPADSPLLSMGNVLLSPHNTNSSPAAWERVHHNTIRNLLAVLKESQPCSVLS